MTDSTSDSTSESTMPEQSTVSAPSASASASPLEVEDSSSSAPAPNSPVEPPPSYVKLAMRNMVRKGGKSLFHFFLTATGLIGLFVGLAYLTR